MRAASNRLTLRAMTPDDVPAGLCLCRAAGRNQMEDDWRCFLEFEGGGCRLAEFDSKAIGSVAFLRYGAFAWIAMMLVDPAHRGLGVGSQLMDAALAALEKESSIRLDATPLGEPLYRRHDFCPESELLRLRGVPQLAPSLGGVTRPLDAVDLARIYELDREVFGGDRGALLGSFYRRAPGFAWLVSDGTAVRGYCFGRPGHLYNYIGPIVADSPAVARDWFRIA